MSFPPPGSAGPSMASLPRLPQIGEQPLHQANAKGQGRVSKACRSCRERKIQCDGHIPRCVNCRDSFPPCDYSFSQKDQLTAAMSQNEEMIALLRGLRLRVLTEERTKIDLLLAAISKDVADTFTNPQNSLDQINEAEGEDQGEADVSAEVGSSTDLDLVDENLLSDEQTLATGFIGKASEIQWLRKLHREGCIEKHDGPYGPPGVTSKAAKARLAALRLRQQATRSPLLRTSKASYYLDDEIPDADLMVDPFEMPPFETAERLMKTYMESCHNSFPFLQKKAFTSQFYNCKYCRVELELGPLTIRLPLRDLSSNADYATLRRGSPYNAPQKWQATLNLVFAIGAVYSHLISAEWRQDERDHFIYHSRATALNLMNPWWSCQPDLPQMQIKASAESIGLATRFGYALGLHIRNEDRTADSAKKEVLSRTWWAHYCFERHLSAIIGRPSLGSGKDCSVPLPLPVPSADIDGAVLELRFGDQLETSAGDEYQVPLTSSDPTLQPSTRTCSDASMSMSEPANSGTYLKNIVKVFEITQEVLQLYDASTVSHSWQSMQMTIARMNKKLQTWAKNLPGGLNFSSRGVNVGHRYQREQNNLYILYHSTMILITRPCLCRLDRRIANQSASSDDFNRQAAGTCVASAKAIADYLPDDLGYNVAKIYEASPWWSMVHNIMQSLTILLLEMTNKATYFQPDENKLIPALKKQIRWLRAMRSNNDMAERAYTLVFDLVKQLVLTVDIDISDLLREDNEITAATAIATTGYPIQFENEPSGMIFQTPGQAPRQQVQFGVDPFASPPSFPQGDVLHQSQEAASVNIFSDQFSEHPVPRVMRYPNMFFTSFDEDNPLLALSDGVDTEMNEEGQREMSHR